MHVELYVHTRDHGEWGLCVVARTRPNLGGYGAARAPNGPAPYNQHFLLPDALHSTSSLRWHRPLTPFSAPTFPILRAKTFRKWEDAFTLNARSGKDYLFTQTWHGRAWIARRDAAQGLHFAPFDATRGGSEVESFHANKSLFSFIRSPKLNEEGRVASPSSPPLVRYCSVTDNSSAALCSSQMTTMTWPLQGALPPWVPSSSVPSDTKRIRSGR